MQPDSVMTETASGFDLNEVTDGHQYLTFICAGEEYGIDILRVQEIKGWHDATRVPQTPDYVLGVMNLRGVIVPVIDLRLRFGLEQRPFDASTVVIVVKVHSMMGEKTMGIVVDGVSEVYTFQRDAIRETPKVGGRVDNTCINGLATADEKMVMLLDIDSLAASIIETE